MRLHRNTLLQTLSTDAQRMGLAWLRQSLFSSMLVLWWLYMILRGYGSEAMSHNAPTTQAWLDNEQVLLGTKCYQLLCANVRTGKYSPIRLPPPVQTLQEPPLPTAGYVRVWREMCVYGGKCALWREILPWCIAYLYRPLVMHHHHHLLNREDPYAVWAWMMLRDAGIRTLTINADKEFVLLGGRNPAEATILQTNNLTAQPRHVLLV